MAPAIIWSSSDTPEQSAASLLRSQVAIEPATHTRYVTHGPAGSLNPPGGIGHATPLGLEQPIEGLRPPFYVPGGFCIPVQLAASDYDVVPDLLAHSDALPFRKSPSGLAVVL